MDKGRVENIWVILGASSSMEAIERLNALSNGSKRIRLTILFEKWDDVLIRAIDQFASALGLGYFLKRGACHLVITIEDELTPLCALQLAGMTINASPRRELGFKISGG